MGRWARHSHALPWPALPAAHCPQFQRLVHFSFAVLPFLNSTQHTLAQGTNHSMNELVSQQSSGCRLAIYHSLLLFLLRSLLATLTQPSTFCPPFPPRIAHRASQQRQDSAQATGAGDGMQPPFVPESRHMQWGQRVVEDVMDSVALCPGASHFNKMSRC